MPRFFVDDLSDTVTITGDEAAHMNRSLRMREGDCVTLCDGKGVDANAVIKSICGDSVTLDVLTRTPSVSEPRLEVTLFQAMPKSDKLEFIVQKATEMGVTAVQPFLSRYCVSRPKDFDKKALRLVKIAAEAAKQSGRGRIPELLPLIDVPGVCERASDFDLVIFCFENASRPLSGTLADIRLCKRVALIIGSEGGFSDEEAMLLEESGAKACLIGPRILRCETAPIAALAAVMFAAGEL